MTSNSWQRLWSQITFRTIYNNLKSVSISARLERWIGGIYNWETKRWVWGATGRRVSYHGFSRRSPTEDPKWHCIVMDPVMMYKWGTRSCVHRKHYICEKPLQVVMVSENNQVRQHSARRSNRRRRPQLHVQQQSVL